MRYKNHPPNIGMQLLARRYKNTKMLKWKYVHEKITMLKSGFTVDQTWGGLMKAWVAYIISDKHDDIENKKYYAGVIQKLQNELREVDATIKLSSFPELKMMALTFYKDNADYFPDEVSGEEIFDLLMERDKALADRINKKNQD